MCRRGGYGSGTKFVFKKIRATLNVEKGSVDVMNQGFEVVRRGGMVSVVGVYGSPYNNFPVPRIFDKGLTIRMGQAGTCTALH